LVSITEDDVLDRMQEFVAAGRVPSGQAAMDTLGRLYRFVKRRRLYDGENPTDVLADENAWPEHAPTRPRFKDGAQWATGLAVLDAARCDL
jgi:hypothetical protein